MQPNTSQDALSQLQNTQAGQKSYSDILNSQNGQLGVNDAQNTVQGLRGAINNTTKMLNQVAPSVMGRVAGSLVTNAQANKQISNESAPIAQNLGQQNQDYSTASNNYSTLAQQAKDAAAGQLGDQASKLSYAQNLYNTLYTKEQNAAQAAAQEQARQTASQQFAAQQALEQQKLAESTRQFNVSSGQQSSSMAMQSNYNKLMADIAANANKTAPVAAPPTAVDPTQQAAYKDVYNRIYGGGNSDAALVSDFKATQASANNGNPIDRQKIQIYQQMRPDLFNTLGKQYANYFGINPANSGSRIAAPVTTPNIFNFGKLMGGR